MDPSQRIPQISLSPLPRPEKLPGCGKNHGLEAQEDCFSLALHTVDKAGVYTHGQPYTHFKTSVQSGGFTQINVTLLEAKSVGALVFHMRKRSSGEPNTLLDHIGKITVNGRQWEPAFMTSQEDGSDWLELSLPPLETMVVMISFQDLGDVHWHIGKGVVAKVSRDRFKVLNTVITPDPEGVSDDHCIEGRIPYAGICSGDVIIKAICTSPANITDAYWIMTSPGDSYIRVPFTVTSSQKMESLEVVVKHCQGIGGNGASYIDILLNGRSVHFRCGVEYRYFRESKYDIPVSKLKDGKNELYIRYSAGSDPNRQYWIAEISINEIVDPSQGFHI